MEKETNDSIESTETHEATSISIDAPVAPVTPSEYEYVPEKFMADGKPDFEKLAGSYTNLESKLGSRVADAAGSVNEYTYVPEGVEVTDQAQYDSFKELALEQGLSPDQFQSMVDQYQAMNPSTESVASVEDYNYDFSIDTTDDAVNAFKDDAMKMGLSSEQYSQIMQAYEAEVSQLQPSAEKTESSLKDAWGSDYDANLNSAFDAIKNIDGIDVTDVKGNPAAIKLLAMMGNDMREDNAPNVESNTYTGISQMEVDELMQRPDYFDNPAIQKQVAGFYAGKR